MSLTPSEKSMAAAAKAIDDLLEAGVLDKHSRIQEAVALLLDQREQSVWEEALKAVPKKRYSRSKEHEHPCYCGDGSCLDGAEVDSWNYARFSLLSARSKSLKKLSPSPVDGVDKQKDAP